MEEDSIGDYHYDDFHIDNFKKAFQKDQEDLIEDSIDNFLRTPIDSRCENEEALPAFEIYEESVLSSKKKSKPIQITVKPSNFNTVLFDWDSTIQRISNKLKPEKSRPKSRGLPKIAQREIQKENQELKPYVISRPTEIRERQIVYPPRKNELPLLRKAPRLLSEMSTRRHRRRYD